MRTRFFNTTEGHAGAIKAAEDGNEGFIVTGTLGPFVKAQLQKKICDFAMTITAVPMTFTPCQDPPTSQGDWGILVRKF